MSTSCEQGTSCEQVASPVLPAQCTGSDERRRRDARAAQRISARRPGARSENSPIYRTMSCGVARALWGYD